jgi:hypothetical protein
MSDPPIDTSDGSVRFKTKKSGTIKIKSRRINKSRRDFLGMTPGQRLLIALLLFLAVAVVGFLCLLVTQKVLIF